MVMMLCRNEILHTKQVSTQLKNIRIIMIWKLKIDSTNTFFCKRYVNMLVENKK